MSLSFKEKIKTRSGRCFDKEVVYVTARNIHGVRIHTHMKRYRKPCDISQLIPFQIKMKAAANLWKLINEPFKNEVIRYQRLYNLQRHDPEKRPISSFTAFIMGVTRSTETITDINMLSTELGNTLNEWITNGYLPSVSGGNFEATIV